MMKGGMSKQRDILALILAISLLLNMFFFYSYFKQPPTVTLITGQSKGHTGSQIKTICPYFRGGLGNRMFEYASVYGMAKLKNFAIIISSGSDVYSIFDLSSYTKEDNSICSRAHTVVEKRPCAYDIETVNFENTVSHSYIHKSYLQSWKYFKNVENDIRQQFVFKKGIQDKAKDIIKRAISSVPNGKLGNVTLVGIHVRRGDYINPNNKKYGYQLASKTYLEKAMKYFRDQFKSLMFLVFTNPNKMDIEWCRNNLKGKDLLFVQGNKREVDMCAISMCNHTIMTVGSFGWWSSFLANGTTIYFKDVAKNGSNLQKDFSKDMSDYFYPGWIGL